MRITAIGTLVPYFRFLKGGGALQPDHRPKILAVVGPTASGKSALALALAHRLNGEIVSCDSMQIYRHMDIGTAKPTADEQKQIRHHLIDILEPEEPFSVNDYVSAAERAVGDILARGKLPIFCGGTGLYLDAFLREKEAETPGENADIRAELTAALEARGADHLHGLLRAVDPESAEAIHPNNTRRVIRALELYRTTGIPKSEWDRRSREVPSRYDACVLGLFYECRELLYRRIEQRVDLMLEAGLVEETRMLSERGVFEASRTAAAAIGYKELLPYLRGACELEEAVNELKTATRRYAKRQITWFSAKPYVQHIVADDGKTVRKCEEIVNSCLEAFAGKEIMI